MFVYTFHSHRVGYRCVLQHPYMHILDSAKNKLSENVLLSYVTMISMPGEFFQKYEKSCVSIVLTLNSSRIFGECRSKTW